MVSLLFGNNFHTTHGHAKGHLSNVSRGPKHGGMRKSAEEPECNSAMNIHALVSVTNSDVVLCKVLSGTFCHHDTNNDGLSNNDDSAH